jgi:hypothetical protein
MATQPDPEAAFTTLQLLVARQRSAGRRQALSPPTRP